MMAKTILYAICKNESEHILAWLDYHRYFNAIFLLDTGSTDNTVELIRSKNVRVDCISYDIMDFGNAKNIAFNRAKNIFANDEECLYVNLDIDEWLDEITFEKMRKYWTPEYDCIQVTRVTKQPFLEDIRDEIIRIHTGDPRWQWRHVLHESLEFNNAPNILRSEYSFLHKPNMAKPRNYGKLAESWIRYFLKKDINNSEIERLLNTCLRSIYFNDREDVDEKFILKMAEERLLNE